MERLDDVEEKPKIDRRTAEPERPLKTDRSNKRGGKIAANLSFDDPTIFKLGGNGISQFIGHSTR